MKVASIVGALVGGTLGALAWAALAKVLSVELGYLAWGVGLAVGGLSAMFGGRGFANGTLCALFAVAAIFAGKVLGRMWTVTLEEVLAAAPPEVTRLDTKTRESMARDVMEEYNWSDAIQDAKANAGVIDIVFAALGILTAFKLGGAAPDRTAGPIVSFNPHKTRSSAQNDEPNVR